MENYINKDTIEQKSALLDRLIKVAKDNAISEQEAELIDENNIPEDTIDRVSVHVDDLISYKLPLSKLGISKEKESRRTKIIKC